MQTKWLVILTIYFISTAPRVLAEGLPANPWGSNLQAIERPTPVMAVHHENPTSIDYSNSVPNQNVMRRNAGGVGKISAPVRVRKNYVPQTENTQTDSDLAAWFGSNETSASTEISETNVKTTDVSEINMDFEAEYERLKRQGLNKWNNSTAPIRSYYRKWRRALQEVSEMDLNDFMP